MFYVLIFKKHKKEDKRQRCVYFQNFSNAFQTEEIFSDSKLAFIDLACLLICILISVCLLRLH